jgi:hypothetical protein
VGEFRHLFGRALDDNELCSCGMPFRECGYWAKVLSVAFPTGFDRERIQAAVRAVNRVVAAPRLRWPRLQNGALREDVRIYRQAFTAAFRAVADVSGARVVVDSTKYPVHGLALQHMPELDLRTMLLVRDPRAVAHSWTRHRIRPEVHWEQREMPRHNVIRSAAAWDLSNGLTRWLDRRPNTFRVQRYEDFVAAPISELGQIASFALGVPTPVTPAVFEAQSHTSHTIAGNPIRVGRQQITVRADDAWRDRMSRRAQWAVAVSCLPQLRRYGYPLHA